MRGIKLSLLVLFILAFGAGNASAADLIKGAKLYADHCAGCHGVSGNSTMVGAPNFSKNEKLMQPDITLLDSIKHGKNAMPAYLGILKDQEIMDVIVYLHTLN